MADLICRALRDGALEGEHAPALTIKDSIQVAYGFDVFSYFLCNLSSNISAAKSQSRGLVIVAFDRSPSFYFNLLKNGGIDVASSAKWIRILDCYTDPLGWKDRLLGPRSHVPKPTEVLFKDVRDLDKFFSAIIDIGKGINGQGKVYFSVAIDSVSAMLRHTPLSSVAYIMNSLRSHNQVSCIFWLIHSDLHEFRVTAALEYMSTMVAGLESMTQSKDGNISNSENLFSHEQNSGSGKFHVRLKRRNGRVKVIREEFHVEQAGIRFTAVSSENTMVNQNLLPKVQFNLQISEKERIDREKVILPFEHQGNGKPLQVYDGRRSLTDDLIDPHMIKPFPVTEKLNTEPDSGKGEIHYFRDSDDEQLDSDEDPDDDLDI